MVDFLPSESKIIENGGKTIKVSLVHAGREMPSTKDTYKCNTSPKDMGI